MGLIAKKVWLSSAPTHCETVLVSFTVKKTLGSGGFGIVELVETPDGQELARKRFSVAQALPPEMIENVRKRFVREAKMQAGLRHRNIVPILGSDLTGDEPWYLMPVAESSLDRDLDNGTVDHSNLLRVVSDICAGLYEMHQIQMFHRDLKPQNVLRFKDEEGNPYFAISDFGFVSLNDSRLSNLTHTGMAKGTDFYTAPEVTRDLRLAQATTDIYSLGCIIHDVVGKKDRIPCAEIKEEGPYGALLRNCTRTNLKKRFKSVAAVRDVLASIDIELPPASNQTTIDLIETLEEGELSQSVVESLADFCEDNQDTRDGDLIFRLLNIENIQAIFEIGQIEGNQIGSNFASWVADNDFGFEYCDVLATRIETFFELGDLGLKADCLMALLQMGVRHNRWYVEEKFQRLAGASMDGMLAKRFAVELRVHGDEICTIVSRYEQSIGTTRERLHPIIVQALRDICT